MSTHIGHEMIFASARSGKTYALTNRFVQLLAHGAKPERIVALTPSQMREVPLPETVLAMVQARLAEVS